MHQKQRLFFFLFCLVALIQVGAASIGNYEVKMYSKPVIVPLLGFTYYYSLEKKNSFLNDAILLALFFSWLGDIFLLFEKYFIPGLICFLMAHVFYISFFARTKSNKTSFFKLRPVMLIAVLAYLIELMYLLWPGLGNLKIPVLIYGITISTMLSAAIWQYQKLDDGTSLFMILGAGFFVTSDSILAIDKFRNPFDSAGVYIMVTYILAQLFIVLGAIKYRNQSE